MANLIIIWIIACLCIVNLLRLAKDDNKAMKSYLYFWVKDEKEMNRLIEKEGWSLRFVIDRSPHWKNHLLMKEIDDDTDKPDI